MKVNKIRMRETIVSYAFLAPVLIFFKHADIVVQSHKLKASHRIVKETSDEAHDHWS